MPNVELSQGGRWLYIGPEPGAKTIHTVVMVQREQIVTWSDPVQSTNEPAIAGWSWLGDLSDFIRFFRPILPTTQSTNAT